MWRLTQHVEHDLPLSLTGAPSNTFGRPFKIKGSIQMWDVDIVVRELVLNAGSAGKRSMGNWGDLADAFNHIRALENAISDRNLDENNVLRHLHRIVHQQFPWQTPTNVTTMIRYHKIFSMPELEAIVQAKLGLSVTQFYQMALATAGNFRTKPGMTTNSDYELLGISHEASTSFFNRMCTDIPALKTETIATQTYDQAWPFSFNPLRDRPLIRFDRHHLERVICPIPSFLMRRVSDGLYYDICNEPGFDNAFGASFEVYVGEVLSMFFKEPHATVRSAASYEDGKQHKHGIDWIVTDGTANLFIECKTKRLRLAAKFSEDNDELGKDLHKMAGFIVQTYKNILDALSGKTTWQTNELPTYPLIVTMEDWWLFSPPIVEQLDKKVHELLAAAGLDVEITDSMPYTVTSVAEIEISAQIMAKTGIAPFLAHKTDAEHRQWAISGFSSERYREELKTVNHRIFNDEWLDLSSQMGGIQLQNKPG
ncbi:hypothetical protein J3U99_14475 [Brucella pituitosa]|uniref:hypothetical protein n=1 Tax=Brucella pituitosa TaxID=571256 RepID=UPI00200462D5|nr:hypothetical protein [Brucella pituitosa]MCK4205979.1 hypothetical protein [Brucella pituitosa]